LYAIYGRDHTVVDLRIAMETRDTFLSVSDSTVLFCARWDNPAPERCVFSSSGDLRYREVRSSLAFRRHDHVPRTNWTFHPVYSIRCNCCYRARTYGGLAVFFWIFLKWNFYTRAGSKFSRSRHTVMQRKFVTFYTNTRACASFSRRWQTQTPVVT
jgi:hypothetical protein